MSAPLRGIKVVAFEQAIALPFASLVLGEMGAEVIKIERPGIGDVVRGWDQAVRGLSSGFVSFNAGKRDIGVDVSHPAGLEIVKRLVRSADVFVENFAPGVAQRLGLGSQALMETNERLIYCSLSGYGQDGPYRDVKAFDLLIQGESGVLKTNGTEGSPAKVGMPITDLIGGAHVVFGVLGALLEREQNGRGQYLDVALLESVFFWLGYFPHYAWHGVPQPPLKGMRHQFICPYGPYMASDGIYVNLAVASQRHWRVFCEEVIEDSELADDPRFKTMQLRNQNHAVLDETIEETFAEQDAAYWLTRLDLAGLPHGRVREMEEVVDHPQLRHRQMMVRVQSEVGEIPAVRLPGSSRERERGIPSLGQHTSQILEGLGYSEEDVADLAEQGVISLA